MSKRLNVLLDEDLWADFSRIPTGHRNRAVNDAIRMFLILEKRRQAAAAMDRLKTTRKADLVKQIRKDRVR